MEGGGTYVEDLEPPALAVAHEAEDRADVVAEDDRHEEATVDEPRACEELVVPRCARRGVRRRRVREVAVLVDREDLLRDVLSSDAGERREASVTRGAAHVVIPAEEHEQ